MININLCTLPFLSTDYSNVLDFETLVKRDNYFKSKTLKTIENVNIKYDNERTTITINIPVEDCRHYDYLFYYDVKGKPWFYFVTNIEQITLSQTKLHLTLDIWTSYLQMYSILPSFVDRCHVPRWDGDIPTYNLEDEGIEYGEILQQSRETICELGESVIVCASTPIGKVYSPTSDNSLDGVNTRGKISAKGFRFIKGYEGFAPYGAYLSGESFRTVGYGSTEKYNKEWYDKHAPFPCTEQLASEIYYERITKEFGDGLFQKCKEVGIDQSITSNQFDAMVSLCYNVGLGGFTTYSTSPWHLIKENPNNPSIRDRWKGFATSGSGVELEGLRLRRIAESDIYFDSNYEMRSIGKYNENGNLVGTMTENNGDGYIPPSLTESGGDVSQLHLDILNSGRKLLGKPYRWGGNYPPLGTSDGTDCSGFCQWAYNDNGLGHLVPGRWTVDTIEHEGTEVSKSNIKECDLIITPGHVVMYSGYRGGKHYILESPRTGLNVREREYTFPSNVLTIRRLI